MKKHGLPIKILSIIMVLIMSVAFSACNSEPEEFVDPDEGMMPEFEYIIFPLLTHAQSLYDKIFSSVEYGNRSITMGETVYYFVEPSEYETESFDSLINGTFTKEYADEYIELMYGGDEPLYVEQDSALYVNPEKLIDYEPIVFDTEFCSVSGYMGGYATLTVKAEDGTSYSFDVEKIDGAWYFDCKLVQ